MSNLNVNNIDVQRIINVLNELERKMQICSILTFKTIQNIEMNKEMLKEKIKNQEFFDDLDRHFEYMSAFRMKHIEIEEETKEEKTSESKDDENFEEFEEGHSHAKEKEKKERKDLIGIDEKTSAVTQDLAKSTRNFCRKYHKEMEILNELKLLRMDNEIVEFCKNFSFILDNYAKKSKMTLEEEQSDKALNTHLREKIFDLEHQIQFKTAKYEALKRERQNFKTNCSNQLDQIDNEIKNLRNSNANELAKLENDINKELNNNHDKNQKNMAELRERLNQATQEYEERRRKNEEEEKGATNTYNNQEGALRTNIGEYDSMMYDHRARMEESKKEQLNEVKNKNQIRTERNIAKEKHEFELEEFKKHEEKLKKLKYENDMKNLASEWIQSQFKGFFIRKTMRKKYAKILAPLKKVPLEQPDPKDKNKNKKK